MFKLYKYCIFLNFTSKFCVINNYLELIYHDGYLKIFKWKKWILNEICILKNQFSIYIQINIISGKNLLKTLINTKNKRIYFKFYELEGGKE